MPNIRQFVISYFGILKAGCVAVPMNVLFTELHPDPVTGTEAGGLQATVSWSLAASSRP